MSNIENKVMDRPFKSEHLIKEPNRLDNDKRYNTTRKGSFYMIVGIPKSQNYARFTGGLQADFEYA